MELYFYLRFKTNESELGVQVHVRLGNSNHTIDIVVYAIKIIYDRFQMVKNQIVDLSGRSLLRHRFRLLMAVGNVQIVQVHRQVVVVILAHRWIGALQNVARNV